ncbi:hypothetical protein EW145_g4844 [Phellinidium pouzarii]|uniref:XPG-I domain-containing protein n=1 Tax=Phellinidium pouzarii TaxID=167371 RepID=A0A4S4L2M8_9AGAM|nr:hypothetical protein EW145_g4844 [Phellinidium pouzarii]
MGVLGFAPFLQKHCPEVVKTLPQRLRGFNGKTIVFDGTLITQRLHWAQIPHRYRHVLGWYRIISELKDNDVNAICVFDGKERSVAKVHENERRSDARRLVAARSALESERLYRLQKMNTLLKAYQVVPSEKLQTTLQEILPQSRPKLEAQTSSTSAAAEGSDGKSTDLGHAPGIDDEDIKRIPSEHLIIKTPHGCENADKPSRVTSPDLREEPPERKTSPVKTSEELSSELSILYQKYQSSAQPIRPASPSRTKPLPSDDAMSSLPTLPLIISTEVSLTGGVTESKPQLLLTQEEGQLWSELETLATQPGGTSSTLGSLINRSQLLSESYDRRTKPPSRETYEESKSLLDAMGVPCIECDGPYEAEALASSLVRHGVADHVASEDTDVLVYEAPLLRNITARNGALVSISGTEVRDALQLSRASYVDYALLLGTDFSPRLRHLGPTRALRLIGMHGCIESVLEHEPRYAPYDVEAYLAMVESARRLFYALPAIPNKEKLVMREADRDKVLALLSRFGLSRAAADSDWDPQAALAGNYFEDKPYGEGIAIEVTEFWD